MALQIRSFQTKLLLLMIAVLLLLLGTTLIAVHVAGQRTMYKSIDEELRVGSRILDQILSARGRQLSETVRVLASDFAFREAVALGDQATVAEALENHGSRIAADAAFLIALDGPVIADTLGGRTVERPFPISALVAEARRRGESSGIVTFDGRPYQLVVVPVLAPRPIAWVSMGFDIDETVLGEVRRLTALDVSLTNAAAGGKPFLISTLPPDKIGSDEYRSLSHPLTTADRSRVDTLLQRSIPDAARPYRQLQVQIFALSSIALILAMIAAMFFARGVSRPLETLALGAQRIERGDYAEPIDIRQHDEIGRLATAFNEMRTGIAEREEQIRFQATHDGLTGLPNRVLFLDRLDHAISTVKRSGGMVAMIMMDVDRFKEINDTLGHFFGDELLKEIGVRLTQTLRESDTVARLGGDEFAVTFFTNEQALAVDVAQRIRKALEDPFVLAGVTIEVNASMGIALCPLHARGAETLMKRADVAMYDAKTTHKPFAIYEPGRDEHSLRRLAILSELRNAIARDELTLHYQPKVNVGSDSVVHAEALVRWRHPVHGLLSPDEFIPLAEQSGNIGMITKWVLRQAIRDCGEWNASGLALTVAVNLSALDLFDAKLPAYIDGLLTEAGLSPSKLVLEITESAVMKDPAYASKILRELKTRGVTLAIDDYGTGYSSLAHLKRLPVDELKIDKSFVQNLRAASTGDILIIRSTIELGHNMGLKVIAEGVEDAEAWRILKNLGCDMAQGYYVSPPLAMNDFREWFQRFAVGRLLLGHGAVPVTDPATPRRRGERDASEPPADNAGVPPRPQ
jgi:diguanylate cyclase (GGDEF)-like protein